MRLVLLGPPGAGKGTQADVISREFNIPHISTGDILREAVRERSKIGEEAKAFMDRGELVPDSIVTEIVVRRLEKPDARRGFILDGFPRTKNQAESLKTALDSKNIAVDRVLYFQTSQDTIVSRLSGRRICPKCNAIYHIKNNPPLKDNTCDKCGSKLYQRKDDREETIKKRLLIYKDTERGVIDYYKKESILREVSGDSDVNVLFSSLIDSFKKEGLL